MSIDIWSKCDGISYLCLLNTTAWRLVESQEIMATRKLVDSLAEQYILEELIEFNKPPIATPYLIYHPLLCTPFRYPPLKYGSRFGKKNEPSLWYGSLTLSTALAEKAFYKLSFLQASEADYDVVEERLSAFTAKIKTDRGIKLADSPFSDYSTDISSPVSYEASQRLGTSMREGNVQAFTFLSARDPENGLNIALYTPKAFLHKTPDAKSFQSWQCIANNQRIEFIRSSSLTFESSCFTLDQFMVNEELPFPAN